MHRERTRERERGGGSKLLELVPNPFDDNNEICSKQRERERERKRILYAITLRLLDVTSAE